MTAAEQKAFEAGLAYGKAAPPLGQEGADRVAAILLAERGTRHADLAVADVLGELAATP